MSASTRQATAPRGAGLAALLAPLAAWWQGLQARFANADYPDTPPYAAAHRLA